MVGIVGSVVGRVADVAAQDGGVDEIPSAVSADGAFVEVAFGACEATIEGDITFQHKRLTAGVVAGGKCGGRDVGAGGHPDLVAGDGRVDGALQVGVSRATRPRISIVGALHKQRVLRVNHIHKNNRNDDKK